MLTAGIDGGAETIKAMVFKDSQILGYSIVKAGLRGRNPLRRHWKRY